jgi:superfamily I DNA/RNA helicase
MISDRIFAEANEQQVMAGHWCIMARTNAEMSIIANMLFRQGMIVNQTSGMKISNKPVWQALKKIIALSKPFDGSYKLQGILYQLVPYASAKLEEAINEVSNNCLCSIDYAIEYAIKHFIKTVNGGDLSMDAFHSVFDFEEELLPGREKDRGKGMTGISVRTKNKVEMVLGNFRNTPVLIELINAMRSEDSLEQLLKLWRAASENETRITLAMKEYLLFLYNSFGDEKFDRFIVATEQVENNPNPAICDKRVELRTIHGSKGMEWDVVYILNDDNYSFPDFNKLYNMRENQGLSYEVMKNIVDSERRLHYVAQTRARNELYITCNRKEASVFVEETFGYEYRPSSDALTAAQMRNAGCNDENGRIVFKACNKDYNAHSLSNNTLLI